MHTALASTSVVRDAKQKLSCCDVHGDRVLVGTEEGTLLVFGRTSEQALKFEARSSSPLSNCTG